MSFIPSNYDYAEGISNEYLAYYYDKVTEGQTFDEGKTYKSVDNEISKNFKTSIQKQTINNKRIEIIKKLTKEKLTLLKNTKSSKLYSYKEYNFRFVNVNDDVEKDYNKFLLEQKLYEKLYNNNNNNNYINKHYFRTDKTNKYLYNITNEENYNNILIEIDNEKNESIGKNESTGEKYVVLNEVQFVNNNTEIDTLLKLGNENKEIAKCYLFDKIDKTENKEEDVNIYVKNIIDSFKIDLFKGLGIIKIINLSDGINLSQNFKDKLLIEIMKNFKNGKIEHFIGIYDFIDGYQIPLKENPSPKVPLAPPLKIPETKLENIAYLLAVNKQLNPDNPAIINAKTDEPPNPQEGGSSFPRIASLLAASQINMPPLLSPISSFYEKYIKYKSKYLKLQKIKSLKY